MAKLRHVAMQVTDLEKSARFYEDALEMTRVAEGKSPIGDAIMLSDGTVNLTLLYFPEGTEGAINGYDWVGLHHIGFLVDNAEETAKKIDAAGGRYFMRLPDDYEGVDAEDKYLDNNGLVIDIGEHDWTQVKTSKLKAVG